MTVDENTSKFVARMLIGILLYFGILYIPVKILSNFGDFLYALFEPHEETDCQNKEQKPTDPTE